MDFLRKEQESLRLVPSHHQRISQINNVLRALIHVKADSYHTSQSRGSIFRKYETGFRKINLLARPSLVLLYATPHRFYLPNFGSAKENSVVGEHQMRDTRNTLTDINPMEMTLSFFSSEQTTKHFGCQDE